MKLINVCVPTLRRYDLLAKMFVSLHESVPRVTHIYIIDNGQDRVRVREALEFAPDCHVDVITPTRPMGVAESWNWFLRNVPEERIIVNDDVIFARDSIARLIEPKADILFALNAGFSCFVIRDSCIQQIGLFDETISPGYAYYEDEDYMTRMIQARVTMQDVHADVIHERSATLAMNSDAEMEEHHRKFRLAQWNYMKKWGGMPIEIKAQMHARNAQEVSSP